MPNAHSLETRDVIPIKKNKNKRFQEELKSIINKTSYQIGSLFLFHIYFIDFFHYQKLKWIFRLNKTANGPLISAFNVIDKWSYVTKKLMFFPHRAWRTFKFLFFFIAWDDRIKIIHSSILCHTLVGLYLFQHNWLHPFMIDGKR